jgi:uncharacterized protein DUF998
MKPWIRYLIAFVVFIHGLIYASIGSMLPIPVQGWSGRSWLLGDTLTGNQLTTVVIALHELAGIALVAAAVAIAVIPGWWRPLATTGALVGITSFAGLWDGQSGLFFDEGGIGAIASVMILVSAIAFPGALRHRTMETPHPRGIQRPTATALEPPAVGHESWRKALLVCGIASSLLYGAMIWAIRYDGYSLVSQVPSELTAIGAPTERLWTLLGPIYTVLVAAFGWGVWQSARGNRAVRIVGGLMLVFGSLGLLWPFAKMHPREVLAAGGGTLSDTLHVVLGGVTVLLMFLAIGFGATAFGRRFRLYSIVSVVVLLVFGALTFLEAPRLQTNLPTPWIGLWERVNISVFLVWVVVLATVLLRAPQPPARDRAEVRVRRARRRQGNDHEILG